MKRTMLLLSLSLAATSAFAGHDSFNLTAHISSMGHEQRYRQIDTDFGKERTYHTYTLTIQGDPVTYEMETPKSALLRVGQDYKAQWKKPNRILELQFTDEKGKEKTESLKVLEESQP